jgi:hypothetical protein
MVDPRQKFKHTSSGIVKRGSRHLGSSPSALMSTISRACHALPEGAVEHHHTLYIHLLQAAGTVHNQQQVELNIKSWHTYSARLADKAC